MTSRTKRLVSLELQHRRHADLPPALARRLAAAVVPRAADAPLSDEDVEILVWALRAGLRISTAAELIGCEPQAFVQRLSADADLVGICRQAVAQGRALVAATLLHEIRNGDARAAMQWLQSHSDAENAFGMGDGEYLPPDPRFE